MKVTETEILQVLKYVSVEWTQRLQVSLQNLGDVEAQAPGADSLGSQSQHLPSLMGCTA